MNILGLEFKVDRLYYNDTTHRNYKEGISKYDSHDRIKGSLSCIVPPEEAKESEFFKRFKNTSEASEVGFNVERKVDCFHIVFTAHYRLHAIQEGLFTTEEFETITESYIEEMEEIRAAFQASKYANWGWQVDVSGKNIVCKPTDSFWNAWNNDKESIKAQGIQVSRPNYHWVLKIPKELVTE